MSDLKKLESRVAYTFKNASLLDQSVTHRSFGDRNNERLEFLGDSILNFVVASALFNQFPDAREGDLSRLRARMVKQQTLAEIARELDLGGFLNVMILTIAMMVTRRVSTAIFARLGRRHGQSFEPAAMGGVS